jgi:hypothetical protein
MAVYNYKLRTAVNDVQFIAKVTREEINHYLEKEEFSGPSKYFAPILKLHYNHSFVGIAV